VEYSIKRVGENAGMREAREREQVEEERPDAARRPRQTVMVKGGEDHEEPWMASVLIDAACAFLAGTKE